MNPLSGISALVRRSRFYTVIASLLIALFLVPTEALARSKQLNAATVHARIVKRGLDRWVGVEETSGVEFAGRIIAINLDSFTLQLFNDPEPVTVMYADVVDLRTGPSRGFWICTAVGIGATAGFAIWGFVHVHDLQQQNQLPNMPTLPALH